MSHLKPWEGTFEDDTGWRLNRHRDSLDITDEELSTSIVSLHRKTRPSFTLLLKYNVIFSQSLVYCVSLGVKHTAAALK